MFLSRIIGASLLLAAVGTGVAWSQIGPPLSPVHGATPPAAVAWESLPVETLQLDFISSPSSGPPDAPVALIEFTDFRCGHCQLHSRALSQLTATYPGKIRRIFKHYPQPGSPGALLHAASIQAQDQGKFWQLHEALMVRPIEEGQPSLAECAASVGLDHEAFRQAVSDPRARLLVQRDSAEGERLGIQATPTTFLNGRRLIGRQSLEDLKRYVDVILTGRPAAAAPVVAGATAKTAGGSLLAVPALVKHAGAPQEETCCGGDFPLSARARPRISVGVTQPSGRRMNPESK
jgi:predicted DsbA family dithiol-disulfide isomerase